MPGPTRWLQRFFWPAIAVGGLLLTVLTDSLIPLGVAIIVAIVVTVFIVSRVRCPRCNSRMTSHEVAEADFRRRKYYDCWACQITWKSELVKQDPKAYSDSSSA